MGPYWSLSVLMRRYEFSCVFNGTLCVLIGPYAFLGLCMGAYASLSSLWVLGGPYRSLCFPMGLYGFL